MADRLVPDVGSEDVRLTSGGEITIVSFIDYTDAAVRRLRDVFGRSVDRVQALDPTVAIRFCLGDHPSEGARIAASAAIAAHRQGRFAAMHRALYTLDADAYTEDAVTALAGSIGLDLAQFAADLRSPETAAKLEADQKSAQGSSKGPHVPMMFIDGRRYDGVWDDTAILEAMERPFGVRVGMASADFFRWAASAGLVLILATFAALAFVDFGGAATYAHWSETLVGFRFGAFTFDLTVEKWVNDGLMALFFLIVGIEIKRELVNGELSSLDKAAVPLLGALGGMLFPALIFYAVNRGLPTAHGWGVPMSTDIAFTLGILTLMGDRIPTSLKIFVSALAIADDLGAIVVIALFYGAGLDTGALLPAGAIFAAMLALNAGRVYQRMPYLVLGAILWFFVHESGLHATLAGVLTAAAIPSRRPANLQAAALQARSLYRHQISDPEAKASPATISKLKQIVDRLGEPGFHLQHALEKWSSFLILPLFAFFNTGISSRGADFSLLRPEISGTMLGLLLGKSLGIPLTVYAAQKLGIARLSSEISARQLFGASILCGIGFTMSIFIASEAFEGATLQAVKLAILGASVLAAVVGTAVLWRREIG